MLNAQYPRPVRQRSNNRTSTLNAFYVARDFHCLWPYLTTINRARHGLLNANVLISSCLRNEINELGQRARQRELGLEKPSERSRVTHRKFPPSPANPRLLPPLLISSPGSFPDRLSIRALLPYRLQKNNRKESVSRARGACKAARLRVRYANSELGKCVFVLTRTREGTNRI